MARIRTIKPEFFLHEELTELSPLHRLLFIGLWCLADKKGRLEDRPKRIKVEILPWDDGDVSAMLDDLQAAGFILRYEAEGLKLIQVLSFEKHQRISGKEATQGKALPSPPGISDEEAPGKQDDGSISGGNQSEGSTREAPEKCRGTDGEAPGKHPGAQERRTENGERRTDNGERSAHETPAAAEPPSPDQVNHPDHPLATLHDLWCSLRGVTGAKSKDLEAMRQVLEFPGATLPLVLGIVKDGYRTAADRGDPPHTFRYFVPVVREELERRKLMAGPVRQTAVTAPASIPPGGLITTNGGKGLDELFGFDFDTPVMVDPFKNRGKDDDAA
jgi:hypothetical protein